MFFDFTLQTEFAKSVTQLAAACTNIAATASSEALTNSARISQELFLGKTHKLKSSKGKTVEIKSPNLGDVAVQGVSNFFQMSTILGEMTVQKILTQFENPVFDVSRSSKAVQVSNQVKPMVMPWNDLAMRGANHPYFSWADPEYFRNLETAVRAGRLTAEWMQMFNIPSDFWSRTSPMQPVFSPIPDNLNFRIPDKPENFPSLFWTFFPQKNVWNSRY